MKTAALLLLALPLASCGYLSHPEPPLEEIYPPDAYRIDIHEGYGPPHESHRVAVDPPKGFAAGAIRRVEQETGVVVASWDYYLTFRGGLGASFGAVGLYGDYLFYDKNDVLICARRRFLD